MRVNVAAMAMTVLVPSAGYCLDGFGRRGECVRSTENGGMGQQMSKSEARTKCDDPSFRTRVLKGLETYRTKGK